MKEQICIVMTLDKNAANKHAEALKELKAYRNIKYLGNVVECLKAVHELCQDPKIVKQANCDTLQKGRILCYEVFKELEALIKRIKQ